MRALCDEGGVSLVMVDEGKQLGEWAGLCKINEEGEATSVVRCSAACVTEFGEDTRAPVLLTYLKAQAPEDKADADPMERAPPRVAGKVKNGPRWHRRVGCTVFLSSMECAPRCSLVPPVLPASSFAKSGSPS